MSKAEDKAWEWSVKNKLDPYSMGRAYGEGYHQAEEDLELTWEDMILIHKCIKDAMNKFLYAFQTMEGQQKVYEDVLRRFKEKKGKGV